MAVVNQRIDALDGIRGVAVLLVVFGHAVGAYAFAQSGVTVFFVLSGFLITTVLIRGDYDLKQFYIRRAKRLLPALLLLVAAFFFVAAAQSWLDVWWQVSWPALTYTASFVAAAGGELWYMAHAWSLAVEEHFYLIWPLVFGFFYRRNPRLLVMLVLGALTWRVALNVRDPIRAYYSSDGNAFAILAGCTLAVVHSRRPITVNRVWASAGLVALVSLGLVSFSGIENILISAAWTPVVSCAISVVIVAACLNDRQPLLEPGWLRWFGTISYGLYLWHFALIHMFPDQAMVAAAASVPVAAFSWYAWERPWLSGTLRSTRDPRRARGPAHASFRA